MIKKIADKIYISIRPGYVVAAGTLIMLMLGIAYVWGVFVDPLVEYFGFSRAGASLPFSVFLVFYTVGMIIGGRLQDKYGPMRVCAAGSVMFGTGFFLSGFAESLLYLILVYGVLAGLGTGFAYVAPVATVVKWFPERKGLMGGIVIFGFGAGAFFLSPLVGAIIAGLGWRAAFFYLGILFLILATILSFFMRNPPSGWDEKGSKKKKVKAPDITPRDMIRDGRFRLAWFSWMFALTAGLGIMGHIATYATETGIEVISAAFILSIIAVSNGGGRIIMGAASDRIGRFRTMAFASFSMAIVSGVLLFAGGRLWLFNLSGIVFGFSFGALLILYPVVSAELFGTKYLGVNYGILFTSYGVGGFAGPVLFGRLHDSFSGYFPALILSVIFCFVSGMLALELRKTKYFNMER